MLFLNEAGALAPNRRKTRSEDVESKVSIYALTKMESDIFVLQVHDASLLWCITDPIDEF
jgi:hypothetical protein